MAGAMVAYEAFWLSGWGGSPGAATVAPVSIASTTSIADDIVRVQPTPLVAASTVSVPAPTVELSQVEAIPPNTILVGSGSIGTIDESPGSPDDSWITNLTELRVGFALPGGTLLAGTDRQSFLIRVRKT